MFRKGKKGSKQKDNKWKSYKKKFQRSIIIICLYFMIMFILIGFAVGLAFYRDTLLDFDKKNIAELESYITVIKKETRETSDNLSLARKYNKTWALSTKLQKNNEGINPNLINDLMKDLAKKYNIIKYDFKLSVPKKAKLPSKMKPGKELDIFVSRCTISFNSTDDVRITMFFNELIDSLTGYVVVNSLLYSKPKKYEYRDFVNISSRKNSGIVTTKVILDWYVTKKK